MDIIVIIILSIVGGVMIAMVAASGIYYSYRSKKEGDKETPKASSPIRRHGRVETCDPFLLYQDESHVDFDSIAVQPETLRPIRCHVIIFCILLFSRKCIGIWFGRSYA